MPRSPFDGLEIQVDCPQKSGWWIWVAVGQHGWIQGSLGLTSPTGRDHRQAARATPKSTEAARLATSARLSQKYTLCITQIQIHKCKYTLQGTEAARLELLQRMCVATQMDFCRNFPDWPRSQTIAPSRSSRMAQNARVVVIYHILMRQLILSTISDNGCECPPDLACLRLLLHCSNYIHI